MGLAVATAAVAALAVAAPSAPVGAAGVTTHQWLGVSAIDRVDVPALQALLQAHVGQVRSGAGFPDGGYIPGTGHGEEAHWQRFTDAYADIIRAKPSCGDLTAPNGPCAAEIAHLMGVLAHGMGDEVFDWLFEPSSPDLDEYYLPDSLSAFQDGGGQELVMDLVAIGWYGQGGTGPLPPLPSVPDLLAAFTAAGHEGATAEHLDLGQQYLNILDDVEEGWTPEHLPNVLAEMPWMSHNLVDGPGGVDFAAEAIAGQWEAMWGRLLGDQPPTEVSVTYPADGERRIPAGGWARTYQPGSAPGRGGARTRITAALTYSTPYVPASGGPGIPSLLPEGAMTLTEVGGDPVAPMAGYPKIVPYTPDPGEHLIDFQPAADLAPCTWYRVDVTAALIDAAGEPVIPSAWEFRTGTDAAGRRCDDDPYTREENHVRKAYADLLGRPADVPGLESWAAAFDRGLRTSRFASSLVGSIEHRQRLVTAAYQLALGRAPDAAGLAFWAGQLRTRSLAWVRAGILASPELYAAAGGTDAAYVERLYELLLHRAAEPIGLQFWTTQLAGGLPRGALARRLLTSVEVATATVRATYLDLLGRPALPGDLDYWVARVRATDERTLLVHIVRSDEYVARAQGA